MHLHFQFELGLRPSLAVSAVGVIKFIGRAYVGLAVFPGLYPFLFKYEDQKCRSIQLPVKHSEYERF